MSYNNSSFETINALARQAFEADGGVHWDAQDEQTRLYWREFALGLDRLAENKRDNHRSERPRVEAGEKNEFK